MFQETVHNIFTNMGFAWRTAAAKLLLLGKGELRFCMGVNAMKAVFLLLMAMMVAAPLSAADVDINALQKKAEQGDAMSQLNLGAAYDHGIGVKRDVDKAVEWYKKAADQGLAEAQFNLAHILVAEDISAVGAAEYMLKAAKQGMPDAQYLMGVTFAEGIGVEPDEEQAKLWLNRAIAQGQKDAAKFLKKMTEPKKD